MRTHGLPLLAATSLVALAVLTLTPSTTLAAGTGQYSPPSAFPLHRAAGGAQVRVGCTYRSYGGPYYECDGYHPWWALDLIVPSDSPVYAAGAGFATRNTGGGYGNYIVVDHGKYGRTLYGHLSSYNIPSGGAWVDQNTRIASSGNTGDSDTPHLHFERVNRGGAWGSTGNSVNPGKLGACHGASLVSYPNAWGLSTWQGMPWGKYYGYADGATCIGLYAGQIVENSSANSWLVGQNLRRYSIPTTSLWYCLTGKGTTDVGALPAGTLAQASVVSIAAKCPPGDANYDRTVNIFDLSILLTRYGTSGVQPADNNYDSRVNIVDLSILLTNYGATSGALSRAASLEAPLSAQATDEASLSISPSAADVDVGAQVTVQIRANIASDGANAAQTDVQYPPSLLRYVGTTVEPDWNVTADDSVSSGTVHVAVGSNTPLTGDRPVATLTFERIAAGDATLSFAPASEVDSAETNEDMLSAAVGGVYGDSGPRVDGFTPTQGGPGTSVVLSGRRFTGATSVRLGGADAPFTVVSDSKVIATVPADAASGRFSVTTPKGTIASTGSFTVLRAHSAPVLTAPSAPRDVSAAARNRSAKVAWAAPASDGGSPITRYAVTASPGSILATVGGDAKTAVVKGLANRRSYTFTVVATNAVGSSPPSAPSKAVRPHRVRCVVPNLLGRKIATAKRNIRRAHCTIGSIERRHAKKSKRGRVVAQSRAPGRRLKRLARIDLTVGK